MARVNPLVEHLAPDTITRLERAAEMRYNDAKELLAAGRRLSAVYLFGYAAEMCLAAAYYRAAGFSPNVPIDRDTRQRRMAQARQLTEASGTALMNSDPHPLVGWARFLQWQRLLTSSKTTEQARQRLKDAIRKAELIYKHWRPELRYKTIDVSAAHVADVVKATIWFVEHRGRL